MAPESRRGNTKNVHVEVGIPESFVDEYVRYVFVWHDFEKLQVDINPIGDILGASKNNIDWVFFWIRQQTDYQ